MKVGTSIVPEYCRWKYRNNVKDKINIDEGAKTRYDPLHVWEDHTACWQMQVTRDTRDS